MANDLVASGEAHSSISLRNPGQISADATRAAHSHLLDAAERMHLRAEPHSSAISAVKLYDGRDRYLFSWIINSHHLLFYIRKPALKLVPMLGERAGQHLRGVKLNPAGEVTIRIETADDARALTEWLFSRATWSMETSEALR